MEEGGFAYYVIDCLVVAGGNVLLPAVHISARASIDTEKAGTEELGSPWRGDLTGRFEEKFPRLSGHLPAEPVKKLADDFRWVGNQVLVEQEFKMLVALADRHSAFALNSP